MESNTIRVSVSKVDQLINLVGELVITQSMLLATAQQMQESAPERLVNGLTQVDGQALQPVIGTLNGLIAGLGSGLGAEPDEQHDEAELADRAVGQQ